MKTIYTMLAASAVLLAVDLWADEGSKPAAVAEAPKKSSTLVGTWASSQCMSGVGPTHVSVITILENGAFHSLRIQVVPDPDKPNGDGNYFPVGAELEEYEKGQIDLKSGLQVLSDQAKALALKSISWSADGDLLSWYADMGEMGGEAVSFRRISE